MNYLNRLKIIGVLIGNTTYWCATRVAKIEDLLPEASISEK
jgi:hypothetical protein